jgi:hypothetical protein
MLKHAWELPVNFPSWPWSSPDTKCIDHAMELGKAFTTALIAQAKAGLAVADASRALSQAGLCAWKSLRVTCNSLPVTP